ncbi:polysaccharide lyase family 8 super-sandwich domain-containing protein [Pontiella sulfatireligans]|nr:polysaccharide lyase family 8 super-sandwich domain-containing protein [Pontiella sulfatireligans]
MKKALMGLLLLGTSFSFGEAGAPAIDPALYPPVKLGRAELVTDHSLIKERYIRFLIGTDKTFHGKFGKEAAVGFLERINGPIGKAMKFDFSKDVGKVFHVFQDEPGYKEEFAVYSALLQQYVLALAYGYTVNAPDNPYYQNPKVLKCYLQCLAYLYGRGVRDGMTFHYNESRLNMDGAPQPEDGAGNLVKMELRMGAYCQSVLLMEPYFKKTKMFKEARALVRHLEMLGKTSGHVRYYDPYIGPNGFNFLAQSDAMQNYGDTTLVSALLETDPKRQAEMLLDTKRVFTDSLKVVPGWADTIKPGFTGYHHRGIYGNAYTGGFIPQAAFGVYVLAGTHYEVDAESVNNVKELIKTYRLYCQKYSMPFGIRGRMPVNTDNINKQVFPGILIYASALGLDDAEMKGIFKRLWNLDDVTLEFLFFGGRGKIFRGMYALDMLEQLETESIAPEPDPNGFWYKPYGGLAIHRRADWMAAVKGYGKYVWDYENGSKLENIYGQYFSHGSLTIFSKGNPINDIDSGYNLNEGWDWYRMPGTTAVHFTLKPRGTLEHREFSPETFLGGVSADGQNGVFGMALNQAKFGDGTAINLKARKSVFFVDDFILMLGSDISGGDGEHAVETTLFQSFLPTGSNFKFTSALADPAGNRYYIPEGSQLKTFKGIQKSFLDNGKTRTTGNYAVAWFDHGCNPKGAEYEAGIGVRGATKKEYEVVRKDKQLHQVRFPNEKLTGYAFFQPLEIEDPIISDVSDQCLVMAKESAGGLELGVANPDLNIVDRSFDVDYQRFINEGENQYLPSRPLPLDVTLKGKWRLKSPSDKVALISQGGNSTVLRFNCIDGMDIRVKLIQE